MPRPVAPVVDPALGDGRQEFVQHQVLPERAAIRRAEVRPAAQVADEAGVHRVDPGAADQLSAASAVEGRHAHGEVAPIEDVQIVNRGRPAHAGVPGKGRNVQQLRIPDDDRGNDAQEAAPAPDVEERQDVPREKAVHPLLEPERVGRREQQLVRKTPVQEAALEIGGAGPVRGFAPQHGRKTDRPLAPHERVTEPPARVEGGGTRGQHADVGPGVRRDLEQPGRVLGAMHLVQNDPRTGRKRSQEGLGIRQTIPYRGQIAVEVAPVRNLPAQDGLPETPRPGKPDNAAGVPRSLDPIHPERAWNRSGHRDILQNTAWNANFHYRSVPSADTANAMIPSPGERP